ncbi:hypothetical protein EII29_01275 [Leptotrichia sp. OH3620_COT-345]|uniref:hypothetical protein n=1 Tax=Leptotrichia sp. OH3620_COT-345 TaxID=2491048 RepID=UPI000F65411E|nr:hypothetical protein [Leptotrichia sp. OH3620_COT-345]RRD40602.1 hypothetical protein EII29_01275 [Leptotrichia sp. OH3620_COT-345]
MVKRLYNLSFRNINELNNISLNFNDVRNILNSDVNIEKTGKIVINSNPDLTYEISDSEKQKEVNGFLSEQIIKIQKRKKVIFETFIKGKDSFLENRNDNKETDYIISVLDFYNFFGKENITVQVNDDELEKNYNEISKKIADRLYSIYVKRCDSYKKRNAKDEYNKKRDSINKKIKNQKREINQSYILMKIFNFIKKNFQYEIPYLSEDEKGNSEIKYKKESFLAEIPVMKSLKLNFSENKININDEKKLELIEKKVIKARLTFDRGNKSILIPESFFGNDNGVYRITGYISENGELVKNEVSKKELFRKLIFEKFKKMMGKNLTIRTEEGQPIKYYAVNTDLYNIDTESITLINIVENVVFKEITDELRPYIIGAYNKDGKNMRKSIKLNDMEKISQISDYKREQIELLFKNKERNFFKKIERKYLKLEKKYMENEVNEEIKKKVKYDISENIKKEKENYFQTVREIKKKMNANLAELERKNKDFSFNFKVKNLRKKEEMKLGVKDRVTGIFLDDIYNILNRYKNFYFKSENILNENRVTTMEEYDKSIIHIDKDFLFIKIFMELWEKFDFVIPLLGEYGEKKSDKFVTVAFFNNMNNVNSFLDNIVYNAVDIHIIKDKYKIFRKSNIKREMLFLNPQGKIERKKVTYSEYLNYKYKMKYKINRKNPFETDFDYEVMPPNIFKYHRILGENIKYLFININSNKELKISSPLFKNYGKFINIMLILDGIINLGNKVLGYENEEKRKEIILRNFIPNSNSFDIYVNEEYIETTHYNLDVNSETYRIETVEQRMKNILSGI